MTVQNQVNAFKGKCVSVTGLWGHENEEYERDGQEYKRQERKYSCPKSIEPK